MRVFSGFPVSTVYQYTQQRSIIGTVDTVGLLQVQIKIKIA